MSEKHITKDEWDNLNWLHVYGQFTYHSEATIRGTREGLTALRDAIDKAISSRRGVAEVIAGDGEGYHVEVLRASMHAELGEPEYVLEKSQRIASEEAERAREHGLRDPFGKYVRVDDPRWAERIAELRRKEEEAA